VFDNKNSFTVQSDGTDAQTFTGDSVSTNLIDFDKANIQITSGKAVLVIKSIAAFDALTSLEILVETDTDSGFATALKQILSFHFALAQLTAGALLVNIPLPAMIYQRYMRIKFNVVGSDNTVGSILAVIADGPEPAQANPDNVNL
jgi:hypothetical protein